mmetsp:Transcript_1861/g.3558  ORF Transcript_1861/g.3558 Transcript_1861/m.3558 type:complete len:100 (+) Transcript_1861:2479-2778(+)
MVPVSALVRIWCCGWEVFCDEDAVVAWTPGELAIRAVTMAAKASIFLTTIFWHYVSLKDSSIAGLSLLNVTLGPVYCVSLSLDRMVQVQGRIADPWTAR